jgi:hypothetical protein
MVELKGVSATDNKEEERVFVRGRRKAEEQNVGKGFQKSV